MCMSMHVSRSVHVGVYISVCVWVSIHVYVFCDSVQISVYICEYFCVYVCMYACVLWLCMYTWISMLCLSNVIFSVTEYLTLFNSQSRSFLSVVLSSVSSELTVRQSILAARTRGRTTVCMTGNWANDRKDPLDYFRWHATWTYFLQLHQKLHFWSLQNLPE